MTVLIVCMLFVFAIMFAVMLSLLLYHPAAPQPKKEPGKEEAPAKSTTEQLPAPQPVVEKKESPEVKEPEILLPMHAPERKKEETIQPIIPIPSDDGTIDYSIMGERMVKELKLKYPLLDIFMESALLDHGLMLHWRGNPTGKEVILLSTANEDCQNACMDAVNQIHENNEMMQADVYLLFPFTKKLEEQACQECQQALIQKDVHVTGVLLDGSDNEYLIQRARPQALVGIGNGAYLECRVNGNPRKKQVWLDHLQPASVLPLHINDHIQTIIDALGPVIPYRLRMELRFTMEKGTRDLLTIMPDTWVWMRASVEKKNDILILRAADQQLLDEAYTILEERASQDALYLSKQKSISASPLVQSDEWIYQRITNAINASMTIKGIVPVIINETGSLGKFENWKTCYYMPLHEKKKESAEAVILFYRTLLLKA